MRPPCPIMLTHHHAVWSATMPPRVTVRRPLVRSGQPFTGEKPPSAGPRRVSSREHTAPALDERLRCVRWGAGNDALQGRARQVAWERKEAGCKAPFALTGCVRVAQAGAAGRISTAAMAAGDTHRGPAAAAAVPA